MSLEFRTAHEFLTFNPPIFIVELCLRECHLRRDKSAAGWEGAVYAVSDTAGAEPLLETVSLQRIVMMTLQTHCEELLLHLAERLSPLSWYHCSSRQRDAWRSAAGRVARRSPDIGTSNDVSFPSHLTRQCWRKLKQSEVNERVEAATGVCQD